MIRPIVNFGIVLILLGACTRVETAEDAGSSMIVSGNVPARIDSTLKGLVDAGRISGVSALIYEKNREVYFNAFGFADHERNMKMDRSTIMRIYSMTKPVTGVALMTLYEKGAFSLDDPLSKYAPEFANMRVFVDIDRSGKMVTEPARRPITIRDLTRHTAGFARDEHPDLGLLVRQTHAMNPENTLSQMAEKLATLPLMAHPGDEWIYGPSVDVQAYLVEKLSGKPFDQYIRETILDPLQMTDTRYVVRKEDHGRFAAMYQRHEGKLDRMPDEQANIFNTKDWPLKPGGYGLTSTVDDYMRFARMLVNGGRLDSAVILKPETVELMATNHLSDSVTERMWLPSKGQVGFGIDFAVRIRRPATPEENNGAIGEFFWDGAASTLFWVDPVNDLTAVLFVQVLPFDRELHKKFRDAVYGPVTPAELPSSQ